MACIARVRQKPVLVTGSSQMIIMQARREQGARQRPMRLQDSGWDDSALLEAL